MINFIFATLFRACYGKDPQNIAELFNFYIAQGVPPGKLYDALKEFKEKNPGITKYEEIKKHFKTIYKK